MNNSEDEYEKLVSKGYELGYAYEATYHGCAQCVLAAIMDVLGGVDDQIFRSASGLAGGLAISSRGTCGALIAGIMCISQRHGRERSKFDDVKRVRTECHKICRGLLGKFQDMYGTTNCGDVQTKLMGRSFDLLDQVDREEFIKVGGHNNHCPRVVGNVAKWTLEILLRRVSVS
jgi:C_GCAxxG_C_C family probable redox protein